MQPEEERSAFRDGGHPLGNMFAPPKDLLTQGPFIDVQKVAEQKARWLVSISCTTGCSSSNKLSAEAQRVCAPARPAHPGPRQHHAEDGRAEGALAGAHLIPFWS